MDKDRPNLPDMEFEDKDIETCVFEAIGAASTCWENMSGTGIFQDGRAKHIGDQLMDRIKYEVVTVGPELVSTEHTSSKEWIERQEEERRAWAVGTAVEYARHSDGPVGIVGLAGQIEEFVKGSSDEDPDLHDQAAFDTWGVVMYEMLFGQADSIVTPDDIQREATRHEFLDGISDALTKAGVRFKTGKVIEP